MKTKLLLFLVCTTAAHAINYIGNVVLAAPFASGDAANLIGNVTFSAAGTYSAAGWNIVGNLQLAVPGDYTIVATSGGINLTGRVTSPNGPSTLHVSYRRGLNLVIGTVATNVVIVDDTRLPIESPPQNFAVAVGGSVVLSTVPYGSSCSYQWSRNGIAIPGATGTSLALTNVQPTDAGIYTVDITGDVAFTRVAAIVAIRATAKVTGSAEEVGSDIHHPNGNVHDQLLLTGAAATITADPGQVTRLSFLDLTNDIVQVEFSGAGTLSLLLDNPSGPAAPVNYDQPAVSYMKGHAGIVIAGADETTNVSVYSVGRLTAVNQALFRGDVIYDGLADLAFIAISSATGKFGGVRTANASYFATKGLTGLYAPNVQFTGPVFIGNINAFDAATPAIIVGSASEVDVTGGDLLQSNGQPVKVNGIGRLNFAAGTTSHGLLLPAQTNKARLEQNGTDVTAQIVVCPSP